MEIEVAGIIFGSFFMFGSGKSENIVCIYVNTDKWDFIVNIYFLCEVNHGVIVKNVLYYFDIISTINE